ncbi:hypothetical protein GOP47_0027567 [Adiantum capillus-veneris]|nr:hypothetical protein GOP47_0027567 [Adiantum capillus-veneris]
MALWRLVRKCRVPTLHSPFHAYRTDPPQITQHALSRTRSITYMPRPGDGAPRAVTLIPGDGIGPLVTGAVVDVMKAMHAPVYFEVFEASGKMDKVPDEVMASIKKNKVCLKGGLATPVGGGVSSLNVQLRKELDLFASLVHCFNLPGLPTRHDNVDIVVIRENTEGEYSGLEHEVIPGVVESLKVFYTFLIFDACCLGGLQSCVL